MPIYSIQGPDGTIYEIEGPEGATKAQVVAAVQAKMRAPEPALQPRPVIEPPKKEGLGAAFGKGLESLLGSSRTAIGAFTGSPEEAALAALERQKQSPYADQVSLEKVSEAAKRGLLPAAGEVARQVPLAIMEQAPNVLATLGSAKAGSLLGAKLGTAVAPGVGTAIGGIGGGIFGAIAPSLLQQFGGNIQRQAQEQQAQGKPIDISRTSAGLAAVPQAGLDVAASLIPLGRTFAGKVLGPQVEELLKRGAVEGAERLARESLPTVLGKGAAISIATEVPTEVIQTMLERSQAGLALTTPDALAEYGNVAYQAGLLAPIGAVGRVGERAAARNEALLPGQRRGESDMDFANRLSQEIGNDRAYVAMQQAEQAEAAKRQAALEEMKKAIGDGLLTPEVIKQWGFGKGSIFDSLVNKNLSNPEDASFVADVLSAYRSKAHPNTQVKIDDALAGIEAMFGAKPTPQTEGAADVGTAITEPSGAGVQVAGEPSAGAATPRLGAPEPAGVVPPVADVGQPAGGAEAAPPAVAAPVVEPVAAEPKTEKQKVLDTLAFLNLQNTQAQQISISGLTEDQKISFEGDPRRAKGGAKALLDTVNAAMALKISPAEIVEAAMSRLKPAEAAPVTEPAAVAPPVTTPVATVQTPETETQAKEQHAVQGLPIIEAPLDQLTLSKDVPQFKSDADEKGVVEKLGGKFDRTGVAPIQVWRRTDGRMEVISGRHRLDLAQRSGEATIPAQIHDEAQGFDAKRAAMLDAELNIRDQQGKVKDYVNYFENAGISQADADARGLLARPPGRQGFAIATQGSPDLIASHRANVVNDAEAFGIASAAPGDARLQALGIKAVSDGKNVNGAVNMMKAVKALAAERGVTEDAGDLFGFDDSAMREAEEMAKIASRKQSEVANRLSAISGASKRPEVAKKEGIDIKDPEALKRREKELRQQKASWDNWSSSSELIHEIKAEMVKPSLAEAAPEALPITPEIQEKIDQLEKVLKKIMNKFGLKDVALKLIDNMKAEGEYAQSVVRLALDAVNPVQALRHESIHALKELGFFSPQQWAVLEKQAKSKWIDQYLKTKNINKEDLEEGQKSRYDAYMELYKGDMDAIIEEAIADAFGDFDVNKAPPGLMQAILTRLRNFFDAVKTAFGGEVTAEQVFRKVEKGALKAETKAEAAPAKQSLREVPLSTRGLMEVQPIVAMQELGLKTDAVRKPGGIELFNDVRSIALALNQDTIRNKGKIAKTDTSLTSEKELARAMVDEIGYQLKATAGTGTGKGWYSDNYPKAVKKLGKLFPELETDPYARTVFSALVAITSNGEKVSLNVKNAIKLYEDIRMGKDPRNIGSRRKTALDNNIAVVLQLMKQYGPTGMRNELLREITVKDMNAILRSRGEKPDTSYLADTKVPAAALYFGPKLGAFFSNLEGAEGYLTMDMWWTRTVNRMRGQLESKATEASIKKFAAMMGKPNATRDEVVAATIPLRNKYEEFGWHTELEELVGRKEPAEDKDKPAWTARAKRQAGPAYEALLFEHRLEKMANTIYKNEYELLEEAPFTPSDREFMYRTARRTQSLLKAEGVNLSLADIQAALWYYEKRLYQHLSGRKADDIGYDEAITQLAGESTRPAGPSVVFAGQPVSGAGAAGAGAAVAGVSAQPAQPKPSLRIVGQPATRGNVVAAMEKAQELQPYINCQLCVQIATGTPNLLRLPKVKTATVGDVYTFNERQDMASHYAIDIGAGDVIEVEAWGEPVRVVPLANVVAEYDQPSSIRRPPMTAYSKQAFVKPSLRSTEKEKAAQDWINKVYEPLPRNPMNPRQRVMMFGEEEMALLELGPSGVNPGAVEIKWFQAYPLRSGVGTKAMRELQQMAADENITLDLFAWDKGNVSQAKLIKFYKSVGFKSAQGRGNMIWQPDGEVTRRSEPDGGVKPSLRDASWTPKRIDFLIEDQGYTDGKTKGFAAFIDPKDFVRATTSSKEQYQSIFDEAGPLREEDLRRPTEPPRLFISEDWKITGHEGRHRMAAMAASGVTRAPVFLKLLRGEQRSEHDFKTLSGQKFDDGAGSSVVVSDLTPLNYENRALLNERFGGEAKVKYSLRVNIPASARARVVATIASRQEKGFVERLMEAISPTSYSDFRAQALNRYNQLGVYDKIRAKKMGGAALLADSSAESAALLSDLGAGLTASALGVHDRMGGIPVFRNGITIISNQNGTIKGPTAIFAPLAADPAHYQDYQFWAGVKRGSRYMQNPQGKYEEKLFTPSDVKEAEVIRKAYLKAGIDFEAMQKEWIKYNDGLVQYMVDTGVLSKERADLYRKHADYLPFYRQMDGRETIGPKVFQAISGVKPPKAAKGGEALIDDFLENIVRNTQAAIQAGVKNVAAQRAAKVAMDIGMASRLGFKSSAAGTFDVLENGQVVTYQAKDELFINAIKSLGIPDLPFIGLLSGPANLLRNLVTKDPGFMLANLMRDSMSAWVTSGVKMTPMVNTFTNFGAAIAGKDPAFQALMNAGILGGYEFSQNVEQSGREFGKALRKQAKIKSTGLKGVAEMGAKPFTSLWDALEKGSTASDAATRMEVYKRTLAETNNEAEALFRALEVMNFNRKGSSAVVRILTAAVPFLNARMQGLDVLYRAASGQMNARDAAQIQKQFFVRGAMIASLSAAYWLLTHDDEEYKKQEQETRDNYWLLPSLGVKIPIPFEIGVLFKVIPERILGYTFGSDTGEDFLKSMARQLTSTLAFNPIPQAVMPLVETTTNFSFFTMRPIVGQGLEGLQPAYQVGPGTSRLAEGLGEMTKGMAKELQVSPMKIDQLISGYTGTMGMYLMNLMDAVYDMNTDSPKPARRFEQMPLIRRFAIDPEARGNVTAYYELKNSVDSIVRTSNMLERTMNYEELPGYLMDNMRMLASKDYILDLEKTMKEFREMKILIRSASMDADAKKDAILAIDQMENQLTSNIQYMKKLAKGD
jgi:uncharacterized protein YcfJ